MHRRQDIESCKGFRHAECAYRVHVCSNDRYARPLDTRVFEGEFTSQFNIGTAFKGRTFRADKNVFET